VAQQFDVRPNPTTGAITGTVCGSNQTSVEMSFQLPGTGIATNRTSANVELRDKRLLEAFLRGKNDISEELVFPSPEGSILDPDNLYHRYFQPVLSPRPGYARSGCMISGTRSARC
jgi:hypothetical protein